MNNSADKSFFKLHPYYSMLIAVGVALSLCVASAFFWLYSDADLDRVRIAAKNMGVELDENKLRGPASEQYLLDALAELTQLAEQDGLQFGYSTFYQSLDDSLEYPSLTGDPPLIHGKPIPKHLHDFYTEHMNVKAHDKLMKCIETLKGHKIELADHLNHMTHLPHVTGINATYLHLCEWMLTLPKEAYQRELIFAFVLLKSYPKGSFIECLVKSAIAGLLVETAFLRIDDVPINLEEHLTDLSSNLKNDIRHAMQIECVYLMNSFVDLEADQLGGLGYSRRSGWIDKMQGRIINRWLRENELMILLDIAQQAKLDYPAFRTFMMSPNLKTRTRKTMFAQATSGATNAVDTTICRLQILHSIICKSPLPFDAHGNPLKEIRDANGKLLGYYTIGSDGIDDGWEAESENQPIWIYGQLERTP